MAQKDRRYTITAEFTGDISGKKRFVVRFCDSYVNDWATRHEAEQEVCRWKQSGEHPVKGKQYHAANA